MADERSARPREPGGAAASEGTAAQVAAMVAEQVRRAIESAERSADDLQRQALDRAAGDRATVHRTAAEVLDRIDTVEATVATLLQTLRDEVARTKELADRAEVPNPGQAVTNSAEKPADEQRPHGSEPDPPAERASSPLPGAPSPRRRPLFGRRRATWVCAVCGRAPRPEERAFEGWRRTGKVSLCPDCQHDGWQLPAGARLPYRAARRSES